MLAIPITPQMAPALLGGFKTDASQRQSPTIRETPKRLAATRAEAEQAAIAHAGTADSGKRSRILNDSGIDDMDTSVTTAASSTNLLLSNGGLAPATGLKPDPDTASTAYSFHSSAPEAWNIPSTTSAVNTAVSGSAAVTTEHTRRRARDEGVCVRVCVCVCLYLKSGRRARGHLEDVIHLPSIKSHKQSSRL